MTSFVIVFLAAQAAYQMPTASALVPPSPAAAVADNPRVMADRNAALTNELRGDIMMARKLYKDAIDFYKREAGKSAVMANKVGIAYHQLGDLDNAKKFYDKAVKLDRKYPEALNNLGTIHYARKSYDNAIKNYQRALVLTPNAASVWTNLGTAFFGKKKYEQAVQAYMYAMQLDPEVFERRGSNGVMLQERSVDEKALYYFTLAKSYAQHGDIDRTLRYVRFALENGFKERERFTNEPEFATIQENEQFRELLAMEYKVL
ncbi:MAG: tetratricopeptide repeat protein [Acidobacteriota bacterium]